MARVRQHANSSYEIFCPGCKDYHEFWCIKPYPYKNKPQWKFNGDFNNPTFTPSLIWETGKYVDPKYEHEEDTPSVRCHSIITDGKIQFLNDCTHELKGQIIELPEIE